MSVKNGGEKSLHPKGNEKVYSYILFSGIRDVQRIYFKFILDLPMEIHRVGGHRRCRNAMSYHMLYRFATKDAAEP